MASWLVIDWDQDQFHVLTAQSARRGVQVTKALTWTHPEPFTPSTAERVGKALREALRIAGIAPAPVIVGLGRDRVFLKELRFPPIAPHEEAALVRFQTAKERAEPADNYAVDYALLAADSVERRVLTVAARREVLSSLHSLCAGAGLKLHAVTPRLFGISHALARAVLPQASPLAPNKLNAVLSIGQRWAELCFFNGERLVQAQALANGSLLVAEVKRNLAVFQAQHAINIDLTGPECLYVFGDAAAMQALQAGQSLPVQPVSPLDEEMEVAAKVKNPAYFAGAVGLAALWSQPTTVAVNLAAPKKAEAPVSMTRKRVLLYGSAAALIFAACFGGMYWTLDQKKKQLARLNIVKNDLTERKLSSAKLRAEVDSYREWDASTVPWLDELYDLSARFPFHEGFRINQMNAQLVNTGAGGGPAGKNKGKERAVIGTMALSVVKQAKVKEDLVKQFIDPMVNLSDDHITAHQGNRILPKVQSAPELIEVYVDIKKQSAEKYTTKLRVPPPVASSAVAAAPVPEPGDEGDEP